MVKVGRVEGWKEIANALAVSVPTAKSYARRASDPLPVRGNGRRWARVVDLLRWARAHDIPGQDDLALMIQR